MTAASSKSLSPNEPAFVVAPRTEIFRVEVPDREHIRRIQDLRAPRAYFPSPSVVGCAQEAENLPAHSVMLMIEAFFRHIALAAQPFFIISRVRLDRHRLSFLKPNPFAAIRFDEKARLEGPSSFDKITPF